MDKAKEQLTLKSASLSRWSDPTISMIRSTERGCDAFLVGRHVA
jgi:hypothetical protein